MNKPKTYRMLFDCLSSLGFVENEIQGGTGPRTFPHGATDTLLLFRRQSHEEVTSADLLSTEVHLHGKGITDERLESLLNDSIAAKSRDDKRV